MTENQCHSKNKPRNIADLFDKAEIKALFMKFLILIGSVEIVIFFICWLYQLGLKEFDRYGNVNIPFPWKTFFLLAFVVPVFITFLLGLFVAAFNHYMQDTKDTLSLASFRGKSWRHWKTWWGMVSQVPFLLLLLLLVLGAGVIYRLDAILMLTESLGTAALKYMSLILGVVLIIAALLGLIWMIMSYQLKKKTIEYQYKKDVMERLGIVFLDDDTMVDADGRTMTVESAAERLEHPEEEKLLPPDD